MTSDRATTVVIVAPLLFACAQVPKEAVTLSDQMGRDLTGMRTVHTALVRQRFAGMRTLLDRVLQYPGVAPLAQAAPVEQDYPPTLVVRFRQGDTRLALFSMIATLGTPLDVSLQHLRLELFFPADDATAAWFAASSAKG